MGGWWRHRGRWSQLTIVTVAIGLAVAGCTSGATKSVAEKTAAPVAPLALSITPATSAHGVPVSSEIGLSVVHGAVTSVSMTRAGTTSPIAGALRDDRTSWVPAQPLEYGATYSAVVTAKSADGRQVMVRTTTFTTMHEPGRTVDTGLYMQNGQTYGVAMPVVVEFDPPVPDSARAAIQKRLFVTTSPAQPGVWSWPEGGRQVWYRAPQYWQPGTTISVRAALQGLPMGNGYYGDTDRTATATIGNKITMTVDNATKQMSVYQDDKLVRMIPVSLGKPSTPSSSGTMVTMSHDYTTIFDTTREGPGGYRVQVYYAMRLTWGGEFIHAAPWSVGDQGHTNVSHGCVNMSDANSKWLYDRTHIGDPVTVKGTEVKLVDGNGWTAWNETWSQYVKGSALQVPATLANWTPGGPAQGTTPSAHPGTSGSPSPTPHSTA